ncbi:MAG: SH3 domain-containing protein [Chloroflexota bacterium]
MRHKPIIHMLMILYMSSIACVSSPSPNPTQTMPAVGVTAIASANAETPIFPIIHTPADAPPTQVSCANAPSQRLIVFERGRVTDDDDETLNLREGPGVSFEIITALEPSETFFVLDGPNCSGGFLWFRVQAGAFTGWLAEGDSDSYYTEPHLTG